MTETQKYINTALTDNGISVSDDKTEKLAAYLDELLRVNTYMNLTAVRDPQEAAVINIADCCACAKYIPEKRPPSRRGKRSRTSGVPVCDNAPGYNRHRA